MESNTKDVKSKRIREIILTTLLTLLGLAVSGFILFSFIITNWIKDAPDLDMSKIQEISRASIIYDKDGEEIVSFSNSNNSLWAKSEEIPEDLKNAFVAIEDRNFYKHKGISIRRLGGAVLGQLTGLADYGGSTITQQLVKNAYLTPELSYKRKAQEIYLAKRVERNLSKDDILEAYMNIIYLGGANYGIKSAALDYFDKDLSDLTLKETALIAGLAQSPNGYNPKINKEKGDLSPSLNRLGDVLFAMKEQGLITESEYREALNEELVVNEKNIIATDMYKHPHFVEYAINEVAIDLLRSEGIQPTGSNIGNKKAQIRNGGYKIYTSLDSKAQKDLEESLLNYDNYPEVVGEGRAEASAIVLENKTYNIVAMAGSREVPTSRETFNRAVHSRQPVGSIIKPLSIFAPAIDAGRGSGSVELDYRIPVAGYGNNEYPGGTSEERVVTMRESLESSNNLSAARFLYNNVSPKRVGEYLLRLGIDNRRINTNGPSLVLGVSDATVLEMVGAYTVFTNNGVYSSPKSYIKVLDGNDDIVLSSDDFKIKRQVFKPSTAWIVTDMMRTETIDGTGKAARLNNVETAGKTGTHEDRVVTYAGMTPYYTSVVKISNDNYLPLVNAWGGTNAAGLFNSYMSKINEGLENRLIQKINMTEANVVKVKTSKLSGRLSNDMVKALGYETDELYLKGTEPTEECNMVYPVCKYQPDRKPSQSCWRNNHVTYKVYTGKNTLLSSIPRDIVVKSYPGSLTTIPTKEAYHAPVRTRTNNSRSSSSNNSDSSSSNDSSRESTEDDD